MKKMNVYPLLKKKIENFPENQQWRVIISFENLSKREKFIEKNKDLKIRGKFDLIPSVNTNLTKEQITNYEKENLIKQIEEDQRLYLSMLDVIEILEFDDYKNSQISFTGKNINVGIIDNGINRNILESESLPYKIKINKKEITHGTIIASI
ncbi:MAG: hypothetical protein ACFFBV_15680, partial [Promethearchaeota archaeon]